MTENGSSATTTFAYDESGFVPAGAHIGHLTGVTRINDSGPSPTTHTAWNTYGMVDHSVDAKGTTVFTNSAWDGIHLFPTVVTSPLGQQSFSHDSNTGALLSYTDLNSETTTYTYDTAGRPLTVHNPDLSGTGTYSVAACYPDANTQIVYQAQTTSLSSPSQDGATCPSPAADTVVAKVKADGLARITDSILVSAPGGAIDTTTTYDVLGRVATVSNPYRSTADPTYGVTQDQYDALGRVTQVTKQDGSFSTVSYTGSCTTSTDEAGKQRKACSDALGRLTNVWEDPAGLNYETDYQYALGNLLRVDQKGSAPSDSSKWRTRLFTYNSLSQLLTANNPESGTISYSYDADGNMISKTAPAPNQTGAATVTTNYTYDALNRLTNKSYSDGSPSIQYLYDSVPWYTSTNSKGRLVETYNGVNDATFFNYDILGRVVLQNNYTPSNQSSAANPVSASYDLAGNLTALTYPSGRTVTNSYNPAGRLDKVQFTQWTQPGAAALTPATYWSVSDNNFYPNGVPKLVVLGSGVSESTVLNRRLQLQQETVAGGALGGLADHAYNYGTQNNGNVMSVTDQLSSPYTQNFTYDALNRLATANESRWGMSYVYDAWGNYLQQNQTAGTTFQHQYTVGTNNRLSGYTYDPAGNLLNDGFHQYAYDAESRISSVDSTGATYVYDADGNRVRKAAGSSSTEYIYFGGRVIAEKDISTGDWTDYVFADGKRIAQAFSYENRIRAYGTANCTSCGAESATYQFAGTSGLNGYAIRSGDTLAVRQTAIGPANVGIVLTFSDGSSSTALSLPDQNGQPLGSDGMGLGSWHSRTVSLTPAQGKTISQISLAVHPTGAGNWSGYFNDLALFSADGTVHPVFSQQSSVSLSPQATGGISGLGYEVNHDIWAGPYYFSVHYYHDDQIGSSRLMTSAEGWPIWGGTFLPYGEEYNPQITTNHYKFTGKERDSETNLDYFGARYYSNGLGRFITPDAPGLDQYRINPQTWNLYTYGRNNPLRFTDPTGNYVCGSSMSADQCKNFQTGLDNAQKAANQLKDQFGADSSKYKDAQRAINAYGKAGIDNGVTIQFGAPKDAGASAETRVANTTGAKTDDNPTGQKITVTFTAAALGNAGVEAHEGSHLADGSAWVASGFSPQMNPTRYATEFRAFSVEANILNTEICLTCSATWTFGGQGYVFTSPMWSDSTVRDNINDMLAIPKSQGGLYELTPASKAKSYTQPKKPK